MLVDGRQRRDRPAPATTATAGVEYSHTDAYTYYDAYTDTDVSGGGPKRTAGRLGGALERPDAVADAVSDRSDSRARRAQRRADHAADGARSEGVNRHGLLQRAQLPAQARHDHGGHEDRAGAGVREATARRNDPEGVCDEARVHRQVHALSDHQAACALAHRPLREHRGREGTYLRLGLTRSPPDAVQPDALPLGLGVALAAPLGDLFESFDKRYPGTKDSGRLLGAHGGAPDRLDAVLFTAVVGHCVWLALL